MAILVTGASAGFGLSICKLLINKGYKVIGASRRMHLLQDLKQALGDNFFPLEMDVVNQLSIDSALNSLPEKFQSINLLVNNAGLAVGLDSADKADYKDWEQMIHTNVLGLTYLTRQILPQMTARKSGHIINIGSIAGSNAYYGANIYGATKAFVKQFSRNLRLELSSSNIRVTNIEPGMSGDTEFSLVRFKGDKQKANAVYEQVEFIKADDIANMVVWVYEQPSYINIDTIEVTPVAQTSAGLKVNKIDKNE